MYPPPLTSLSLFQNYKKDDFCYKIFLDPKIFWPIYFLTKFFIQKFFWHKSFLTKIICNEWLNCRQFHCKNSTLEQPSVCMGSRISISSSREKHLPSLLLKSQSCSDGQTWSYLLVGWGRNKGYLCHRLSCKYNELLNQMISYLDLGWPS